MPSQGLTGHLTCGTTCGLVLRARDCSRAAGGMSRASFADNLRIPEIPVSGERKPSFHNLSSASVEW